MKPLPSLLPTPASSHHRASSGSFGAGHPQPMNPSERALLEWLNEAVWPLDGTIPECFEGAGCTVLGKTDRRRSAVFRFESTTDTQRFTAEAVVPFGKATGFTWARLLTVEDLPHAAAPGFTLPDGWTAKHDRRSDLWHLTNQAGGHMLIAGEMTTSDPRALQALAAALSAARDMTGALWAQATRDGEALTVEIIAAKEAA